MSARGPERGRAAQVALAVAAAAVVVAAALALRPQKPVRDEPPPAPPEARPIERPPEFPAVRDDGDRILHWIRTLQVGADDDVAWASALLREAGPAGRRAVRDAAFVAVESNPALVEQALEFLLEDPQDEDAPFALAALRSHDPQAVLRAIRLLAVAPGRERAETAVRIADAALAGSAAVRNEALAALARLEDRAAAEEALRVLSATPETERAGAYTALAGARHPHLVEALRTAFGTTRDVRIRFALADALVASEDRTPVPWLEGLVDAAPEGPLDYADAAVGVLARLASPRVLARIVATASDRLGSADDRIVAIRRLAAYPLEAKRDALRAAAEPAPGVDVGVIVEALEALVRAGDEGALERLASYAREGTETASHAAALVYGRLRREDASPALLAAIERKDLDDSMRALNLRALVLSGDPATAERVVRIIAADHVAYEAPISLAYNAGAMLGDCSPRYRDAVGEHALRALRGEFGEVAGAGLVQLIRAAGLCSGPAASPLLAPFLTHADAEVRLNAALAMGHAAGPDTVKDLRAAWWAAPDRATRDVIAEAMERAHYRAAER